MSKILTVNHTCDHTCESLHKSLKKEFSDPVLQGLSVELEQKYNDMTEAMLSEIFEFLDIGKQEISKGLNNHKYVKRTGGPGNYQYWYKMPDGSLQAGKNAPEGHSHHDPEAPKHKMSSVKKIIKVKTNHADEVSDSHKIGKKVEIPIQHLAEHQAEEGKWEDTENNYRLNNLENVKYAIKDNKVIGHLGLGEDENGNSQIKAVYVDPEHRGNGVAEHMYTDLFKEGNPIVSDDIDAMELEVKQLWLKLQSKNPTSISRQKDGKFLFNGNFKASNTKSTIKKTVVVKKPRMSQVISANPNPKPTQKTKPVSTLGAYKSITKTNLVGDTDFSNVDPKVAANLHKALNGAELVMQAMNLQLKTPIKFVSANYPDETAEAFYHPDENKIEFVKHNPDSATIMHEIGHAIDIAMSSTSNYNFNQFYEDIQDRNIDKNNLNPAQSLMYDIIKEAKSSPYYQEARAGHKSYLNDPTEIFARAFEMHSFKIATDLIDSGKLPSDFLTNFMPDLNRTASFKNTQVNAKMQAENEVLNKQIIEAVISKNKPQETALRAKQQEVRDNILMTKQTVEGAGRGDAAINRISDMVGKLLKLEKIKKSNDR